MYSQISSVVTFNARSPRSLLNILRQSLPERKRNHQFLPNSTLLFALAPSPTTPPATLSEIVSTVTQFYPQHVGCISTPLPCQYLEPRLRNGPNSCSLACAFVNAVSFRSTISGRTEAQVGRWHGARERGEDANAATRVDFKDSQMHTLSKIFGSNGKVIWEDIWERAGPASMQGHELDSEALPDALRDLDPSSIDNILYFSDKAPEGLAMVLEAVFPRANKLSLIASSTPFITGRPVTLFYNGSVLSNGAVGVAFSSSHLAAVEFALPPLVSLSTNLTVTSSEGNLILSLDSENPTRLLLGAIQKHGLSSRSTYVSKEGEFYVGVIDPSSQRVSQLHRINAGEPSRGSIALDGDSAPREGSIVRLYHKPPNLVPDTPALIPETIPNISLFVAPEMVSPASFEDDHADGLASESGHSVVSNAFLAASENGFTLSRGAQSPWKCVVPGARTGLSWDVST